MVFPVKRTVSRTHLRTISDDNGFGLEPDSSVARVTTSLLVIVFKNRKDCAPPIDGFLAAVKSNPIAKLETSFRCSLLIMAACSHRPILDEKNESGPSSFVPFVVMASSSPYCFHADSNRSNRLASSIKYLKTIRVIQITPWPFHLSSLRLRHLTSDAVCDYRVLPARLSFHIGSGVGWG